MAKIFSTCSLNSRWLSSRDLIPENWFNGAENEIRRQEVRMKIDHNVAKLGRNDSKFFLINISPSQKELAHLFAKYDEQGKGKAKGVCC